MTKRKKLLQNVFCAFLIALPLIDVYRSFLGDTVSVCGIALEELVLILWAGGLFVCSVILGFQEKKKKTLLLFGIYILLFGIFLVLHGLNASKFNPAIFASATPSFVVECYYLVRVYALPLSLAMSAVFLSVPLKKLAFSATVVALEISLCIIVTNLLEVSFISYSTTFKPISGSIFTWGHIPEDVHPSTYTSKGFFRAANGIGALMFALTPFVFGNALMGKSKLSLVATVLLGLACILLGTKVAMFGFALALIAVLAAFIVTSLFGGKIKKVILPTCCTAVGLGLYVLVMLSSPGYRMQKGNFIAKLTQQRETRITEISSVVKKGNDDGYVWTEEDIRLMEEYMENTRYYHYINDWFLEIYPVRGDMDFWTYIVTRDNKLNQSNRDFKIDLDERIIFRNHNGADGLLGVGYTSQIPYTERDYVYQEMAYGKLGAVLLIGPYILSAIVGAASYVVGTLKKKNMFFIGCVTVALGAYLFVAYYAGHVFDNLMNMYFMAAFAALPFIPQPQPAEKTETQIPEETKL